MNALELRAIAYVVAAGVFVFCGYRLAANHYETIIARDRAATAELAAQSAVAAKAKQDAADENNARVIGQLQTQLDSSRAVSADLVNRLRDTETARRQLSQAANKPGAIATGADAGQRDLASVCAAVDAEDQTNAARLNALISELKPQL